VDNQQRNIINEGLRPLDLESLVHPIMEVDTYKSKMGEDRDVCVISFQVADRSPAKDLMEFIEKGYGFVLDADISSGENEKGEYFVFVEIERNSNLAENIQDIIYGVRKLTGIKGFDFKYHKSNQSIRVDEDNLKKIIPHTPGDYDGKMLKFKTEEIRNFFNKTLMDDLTLDSNVITIHKPFNKNVKLEIINQDDVNITEDSDQSISIDDVSVSEIFWMTKVLGDYDIVKYGDRFIFNNNNKTMTFKRIE